MGSLGGVSGGQAKIEAALDVSKLELVVVGGSQLMRAAYSDVRGS